MVLATNLFLCPFSATVVLLNHSSRGVIRGVRSSKEKRRIAKSTTSSRATPSITTVNTNPLAMNRTSTMGSSRSRRSPIGTFLTRVTSTRSQSRVEPITPSEEGIDETGRITPFTSSHPSNTSEEMATLKGRIVDRTPTGLEMETKWGQAGNMASGSGSRAEESGGEEYINQVEMDTKWGGGGLSSLGPPVMPAIGEAGPSGTPELERDIKWPIINAQRDHLAGATDQTGSRSVNADGNQGRGRQEESSLEMDLKWQREIDRASGG